MVKSFQIGVYSKLTMDPFKTLPSAVFDHILQNFSGKEILKYSEVSLLWDHTFGESKVALKKIKIGITWHSDRNFFGEVSEIIVNSPRRYQNIDYFYQPSCWNSVKIVCDILSAANRQWKIIKLKRISFQSADEIIKLFNIFASTVEQLDINEIYIFNHKENRIGGLKFPKLKDLRIKHVDLFFIDAFENCKNLRTLSITSGDPLQPSVDIFKKILVSNKLTSLEISSNLFQNVFDDNEISSKVRFRLKSFVASELFKITTNIEKIRKNFIRFLEFQMDTLLTLSIDEWLGIDVLKFMFHIVNLKSLSIRGLNNIQIAEVNSPIYKNSSIKSFYFHDVNPKFEILKWLVQAIPKLEEIEVHSMNQNSLEFLSKNATHLKSLRLRTLNGVNLNFPDLFPKLESFHIDVITSDLEDEIAEIPSKTQNRLVKLLLNSSYTVLH